MKLKENKIQVKILVTVRGKLTLCVYQKYPEIKIKSFWI